MIGWLFYQCFILFWPIVRGAKPRRRSFLETLLEMAPAGGTASEPRFVSAAPLPRSNSTPSADLWVKKKETDVFVLGDALLSGNIEKRIKNTDITIYLEKSSGRQ